MNEFTEESLTHFFNKRNNIRKEYDTKLASISNKFFADNNLLFKVDDKVICNVNKNIYGKSHVNAVIYRIIIDRNKTPRIMCFTDKTTYIYCNVEDIKKI